MKLTQPLAVALLPEQDTLVSRVGDDDTLDKALKPMPVLLTLAVAWFFLFH